MTYDELINALSTYSVDLDAVPKSAVTETNFRKALKQVKEILYRYKWHNLRKNPDDLPQDIGDVLVYTQCGKYATAYYGGPENSWKFYNADTNLDWEYVDESNCDDRIIAWREIEMFEEVET